MLPQYDGALAQLGERLHGMQEVSGSIPLGSTNFPQKNAIDTPSSTRLFCSRPSAAHFPWRSPVKRVEREGGSQDAIWWLP